MPFIKELSEKLYRNDYVNQPAKEIVEKMFPLTASMRFSYSHNSKELTDVDEFLLKNPSEFNKPKITTYLFPG